MRMNCDAGGLRTMPPREIRVSTGETHVYSHVPYTGHKPPSIRNNEDLPQPMNTTVSARKRMGIQAHHWVQQSASVANRDIQSEVWVEWSAYLP